MGACHSAPRRAVACAGLRRRRAGPVAEARQMAGAGIRDRPRRRRHADARRRRVRGRGARARPHHVARRADRGLTNDALAKIWTRASCRSQLGRRHHRHRPSSRTCTAPLAESAAPEPGSQQPAQDSPDGGDGRDALLRSRRPTDGGPQSARWPASISTPRSPTRSSSRYPSPPPSPTPRCARRSPAAAGDRGRRLRHADRQARTRRRDQRRRAIRVHEETL